MNILALEAKNPRDLTSNELYTLLDSYGIKPMIDERDMQHGMAYNGQDVTGWIATEKLDGVRAYWDGSNMWTRGGHAVDLPRLWRENLPKWSIDGELFAGYDMRRLAVRAVRYGSFDPSVKFYGFDLPWLTSAEYEERLRFQNSMAFPSSFMGQLPMITIENLSHAEKLRDEIKAKGGEGLMLRHPELEYRPGRTDKMLKLK